MVNLDTEDMLKLTLITSGKIRLIRSDTVKKPPRVYELFPATGITLKEPHTKRYPWRSEVQTCGGVNGSILGVRLYTISDAQNFLPKLEYCYCQNCREILIRALLSDQRSLKPDDDAYLLKNNKKHLKAYTKRVQRWAKLNG